MTSPIIQVLDANSLNFLMLNLPNFWWLNQARMDWCCCCPMPWGAPGWFCRVRRKPWIIQGWSSFSSHSNKDCKIHDFTTWQFRGSRIIFLGTVSSILGETHITEELDGSFKLCTGCWLLSPVEHVWLMVCNTFYNTKRENTYWSVTDSIEFSGQECVIIYSILVKHVSWRSFVWQELLDTKKAQLCACGNIIF